MISALHAERQQLLSVWESIDFDRMLSMPRQSVRNLAIMGEGDIGINLRHAHDLFGWRAGGDLRRLGLCSGALYRTEAFMEIPQTARSGSKRDQNVHIEHTIPVNVLGQAWLRYRSVQSRDIADIYAWLLTCSVTTAFAESQKTCLRGCARSSFALTQGHSHHRLPFMRYMVHPGLAGQICNIVTGDRVEPLRYSFHDHLDNILGLMKQSDSGKRFAAIIGDRCRTIADSL